MLANRPTTLLAELTHRCPLHCPYCSNPLEMIGASGELTTEDWKRVFTDESVMAQVKAITKGA